eukprot:CFRG7886T1
MYGGIVSYRVHQEYSSARVTVFCLPSKELNVNGIVRESTIGIDLEGTVLGCDFVTSNGQICLAIVRSYFSRGLSARVGIAMTITEIAYTRDGAPYIEEHPQRKVSKDIFVRHCSSALAECSLAIISASSYVVGTTDGYVYLFTDACMDAIPLACAPLYKALFGGRSGGRVMKFGTCPIKNYDTVVLGVTADNRIMMWRASDGARVYNSVLGILKSGINQNIAIDEKSGEGMVNGVVYAEQNGKAQFVPFLFEYDVHTNAVSVSYGDPVDTTYLSHSTRDEATESGLVSLSVYDGVLWASWHGTVALCYCKNSAGINVWTDVSKSNANVCTFRPYEQGIDEYLPHLHPQEVYIAHIFEPYRFHVSEIAMGLAGFVLDYDIVVDIDSLCSTTSHAVLCNMATLAVKARFTQLESTREGHVDARTHWVAAWEEFYSQVVAVQKGNRVVCVTASTYGIVLVKQLSLSLVREDHTFSIIWVDSESAMAVCTDVVSHLFTHSDILAFDWKVMSACPQWKHVPKVNDDVDQLKVFERTKQAAVNDHVSSYVQAMAEILSKPINLERSEGDVRESGGVLGRFATASAYTQVLLEHFQCIRDVYLYATWSGTCVMAKETELANASREIQVIAGDCLLTLSAMLWISHQTPLHTNLTLSAPSDTISQSMQNMNFQATQTRDVSIVEMFMRRNPVLHTHTHTTTHGARSSSFSAATLTDTAYDVMTAIKPTLHTQTHTSEIMPLEMVLLCEEQLHLVSTYLRFGPTTRRQTPWALYLLGRYSMKCREVNRASEFFKAASSGLVETHQIENNDQLKWMWSMFELEFRRGPNASSVCVSDMHAEFLYQLAIGNEMDIETSCDMLTLAWAHAQVNKIQLTHECRNRLYHKFFVTSIGSKRYEYAFAALQIMCSAQEMPSVITRFVDALWKDKRLDTLRTFLQDDKLPKVQKMLKNELLDKSKSVDVVGEQGSVHFDFLYGLFASAGDYEQAVQQMLVFERRLRREVDTARRPLTLMKKRCEALECAINAMALIPADKQALAVSSVCKSEVSYVGVRVGTRLDADVDMYAPFQSPKRDYDGVVRVPGEAGHRCTQPDHAVITMATLDRMYVLIRAHEELMKCGLPVSFVHSLEAVQTIQHLVLQARYDIAISLARVLIKTRDADSFKTLLPTMVEINMADAEGGSAGVSSTQAGFTNTLERELQTLVEDLAARCVHVTLNNERVYTPTTEWLKNCDEVLMFRDHVSGGWVGMEEECTTPTQRAWNLLRAYLQGIDSKACGYRYHTAVAARVLKEGFPLPAWLLTFFRNNGLRLNLMTVYVDANSFTNACRVLIDYVNSLTDDSELRNNLGPTTISTFFPWQLMSRVMAGFTQNTDLPWADKAKLDRLRSKLQGSVKELLQTEWAHDAAVREIVLAVFTTVLSSE